MKKYKILWIDDQWEELTSFKDLCEELYNMKVVPCRFAEEGMVVFEKHIMEWSGVILDAKVLFKNEEEVANIKGLQYCINKINELKHKRVVPYYIQTGQADLLGNGLFSDTFGKFYEKAKDENQLISDIISNAENLLEIQIVDKYKDVFDVWPDRRNELVGILRVLEMQDYTNANCLNEIRKMMEDVMSRLNDCGLLLGIWSGTNLNDCSRLIGKINFIPEYIARSFHFVCSITNPGSHRTELEQSVKESRAPYLVYSTIMDLLNILYWCKNLPSPEQRDMIEDYIHKENPNIDKYSSATK